MEYTIEKKEAFSVIANEGTFSYTNSMEAVPRFWQEHFSDGKGAVVMGTYGISIDTDPGKGSFDYLIADPYDPRKEVPAGFIVRTIPGFEWAVFSCRGAMPNALQSLNMRIQTEWLPTNGEYEFAAGYCVEYYDDPVKYAKGTQDDAYYCEVWVPVKKKQLNV